MNLSAFIAKRYLFSKKSHNAINIISLIAVCGVAVATMATVCAMSVLNGFQDLVSDMFSAFDPQLKITPAKGKVFDPKTDLFLPIYDLPEVEIISECLEENALLRYQNSQQPIVLKGVEDNYAELTSFEDILLDGNTELYDGVVNYGLLGIGLAQNMGINARFVNPMEIYAPKRNAKVNPSNPASAFTEDYAYIGGVFMVNQAVYDENYMLIPIALARSLFDYETEVSALELKLKDGASVSSVQKKLTEILGEDYIVADRYQQQQASFKMMQVEKFFIFLILLFILLITIFNVIGSLSMLMLDKQEDIITLRNLGADNKLISRIFLFEGWMISALGALGGLVLGVLICLGQQTFGWIKLGTGLNFAVSTYPVSVSVLDLFFILATVLIVSFFAVQYPVHYLSKKWLR